MGLGFSGSLSWGAAACGLCTLCNHRSMTMGTGDPTGLGLRPTEHGFLVGGAVQGVGCAAAGSDCVHGEEDQTDPQHPVRGKWSVLLCNQSPNSDSNDSRCLSETETCRHYAASI